MDGFMREAMEAGALGMSTGLEFNPGREATIAELERLNAIAGEYDGIYTSHVRNRDSGHPATRSPSSWRSRAPAASARRSRTSTCATTRMRRTAAGSARSR